MKSIKRDQEKELGKVSWTRNFYNALKLSKEKGMPIFLMFQEVPGCFTCVSVGENILSNPLFVDLIEHEFIPLVIYNNVEGEDRVILNLFNEKAWNNPTFYFLNDLGENIVPKFEDSLNSLELVERAKSCLLEYKKTYPKYLDAIINDIRVREGMTKTTIYETPCFWSGETTLIQHPAIYTTEAGWIGEKEVVKVHYNANIVKENEIDEYAKSEGFYLVGNHEKYRADANTQYYLKNSIFKHLPMNYYQRSMVNFLLPYKQEIEILSPTQEAILNLITLGKAGDAELYKLPIEKSWPLF